VIGSATESVGADSDDADVIGGAGGRGRKCCAPTIPIMVPAFSAVTSRQFGGSTSGGRGDTGLGLLVLASSLAQAWHWKSPSDQHVGALAATGRGSPGHNFEKPSINKAILRMLPPHPPVGWDRGADRASDDADVSLDPSYHSPSR
jgi:hypothetical protein